MEQPQSQPLCTHLVTETTYVVADCKHGHITLPCEIFAKDMPIHRIHVAGIVNQASTPCCRTMLVDAIVNDTIEMVGHCSDYSQSVPVYATEIGRTYGGAFGKKMRNLDTQLRKQDVANGLASQTHGCWGLNAAELPAGSSLLIRLGPFLPADGSYIVKFEHWKLVDVFDSVSFKDFTSEPPAQPQPE